MKTLAVIKNELFKDLLRFVSTSDLASVLDNEDIPVPYTCLESVDNNNADALLEQLTSYFNRSKIKNKKFYNLDEDSLAQLQFMLNLIKLSSGQPAADFRPAVSQKVTPVEVDETPEVKDVKVSTPVKTETPNELTVQEPIIEAVVTKEVKQIEPANQVEDVFSQDEFDPFALKTPLPVTEPVKVESVVKTPTVEMIASLGIEKNTTIHFVKDSSITATIIDEKTVSFAGQNMTLVEAAKAAFKQSGTVGMAVGLSNWSYKDETLKAWKEKQMN